ncbi:MAG: glycosyltransferase family 4 protein [Acidobacteriota bacterium]
MSDRAVRVCMFSNLFPPVPSGSSTQTAALSRELVGRGHQVDVITARVDPRRPEYEEIDGVRVHRLPALRLPRLDISLRFPWLNVTLTPRNLRRIGAILDRAQPDVLHLHNHMFDLAFAAVWMKRRRRIPLLVTLHTILEHPRPAYNLLIGPVDRRLLRHLVIRQADAVLCPDLNIRRYAARAFGRGDGILIPYGITLPEHADPEVVDRLREQYQLAGRPVILSLGHVHDKRDRRELIEAMPAILRAWPRALLLIVGAVSSDTPGRLMRKLGIERSVVLAGAAPHTEVRAYMEVADLEAHWLNEDSIDDTSLGIASLEAMSAGRVVVAAASEDSYGPGVLKNGENVVLVARDPADVASRIIELLGDPDRRAAIGGRASETIRNNFSWDAVCERTTAAYAGAIEQASTKRGRITLSDHQ